MLKIGMTGGIASGKSIAAKQFANLGVGIIDTDIIAHELVASKTPLWQTIVTRFGENILHTDGNLNRQKLRKIIFSNHKEKQWLENLLHPQIRKTIKRQIKQLTNTPYCIIVIPLLVENLPNALVDRILVIDTQEVLQRQRAMQRDNIDTNLIQAIMTTQATREQRLEVANDIIENNTTTQALANTVAKMHAFYLELTKNTTSNEY